MVSVTAWQDLTPGKDPIHTVQGAGWASRPVWTGAGNLAPPGFDPRTVKPVGRDFIVQVLYVQHECSNYVYYEPQNLTFSKTVFFYFIYSFIFYDYIAFPSSFYVREISNH